MGHPTEKRDAGPGRPIALPDDVAQAEAHAELTARLKALAEAANRGDQAALVGLRRLLDDCPAIWQRVGDLAPHAELAWLALIAGEDALAAETIKRTVAQ